MHDPYAEEMRQLAERALHGPGTLDAAVRQAIANAAPGAAPEAVPEALRPYAEKVTREAYRVTDEDVRALLAAGYSEDQIFEATVCAALGAALVRLQAGLGAIAPSDEPEGA